MALVVDCLHSHVECHGSVRETCLLALMGMLSVTAVFGSSPRAFRCYGGVWVVATRMLSVTAVFWTDQLGYLHHLAEQREQLSVTQACLFTNCNIMLENLIRKEAVVNLERKRLDKAIHHDN
eukprot:3105925-Lingulodinium_polyedra.AAC.1